MNVFEGGNPVILGQPRDGTYLLDNMFNRLNARGQGLGGTDWHIDRFFQNPHKPDNRAQAGDFSQ